MFFLVFACLVSVYKLHFCLINAFATEFDNEANNKNCCNLTLKSNVYK